MADVFEKSKVKVWECRNCGHIIVGTAAPVICPTAIIPRAILKFMPRIIDKKTFSAAPFEYGTALVYC